MQFIRPPMEPKPKLISDYWVHYGPVHQDSETVFRLICSGEYFKKPMPMNPRNLVYRHIFDLNLAALGWDLLPEDHLLVNENGSIVISRFANAWAKRTGVKWMITTADDSTWIEVDGREAAMKVKLRWA